MDARFKDIKVCIWDFDGTLYKPNPDLWAEIREAEYRVIADHTQWDKNRTRLEFEKVYKVQLQSATETVARLSGITTEQAALEMEQYYDRRKYLVRDEILGDVFKKLAHLRHFILANGVKYRLEQTLDVIGIPKNTFELIVTSEMTGVNKPNEIPFRYIIDYSRFAPADHLLIGDREKVDLVPARAVGMKTCMVWTENESSIADATLKTVYDVVGLLV
jgi:putative hydrolase of the HAD superfamily